MFAALRRFNKNPIPHTHLSQPHTGAVGTTLLQGTSPAGSITVSYSPIASKGS